ncbi:MAG: DUF2079 domain-containing protein [Actinomycetales bacterium]|nr:MAG: DUF2079 domain-containing protein [Actinomycetales bacterium]
MAGGDRGPHRVRPLPELLRRRAVGHRAAQGRPVGAARRAARPHPRLRRRDRRAPLAVKERLLAWRPVWPALLWAVACAAAYTTLSVRRYDRFELASYDNAIFQQAVRGYAHLGRPIVDIKGPGYNILGDHFSPVTALIAPFYAVWPVAETLFVAQAVLIGISVYVIAALAVRHTGAWVGGTLGLAYGISFGLQSAVRADFHEVAFGAPLLALAGSAFVEQRYRAVIGWSLPLLLVKEDLGLTVAVVGVVLWLVGERRKGVGLAVAGLLGGAIVLLVVIPSFNPGGEYAYASSVGGERGVLETLLDEPGRKAATVLLTLGVTGLAAVASPWVLLVLPTFAWRFVGDNPYYWGIDWHYSILLMPIVFVAAIDAMRRWPVLRISSVAALAVTVTMFWSGSPLSTLLDADTWDDPPRAAAAREVIELVPDGASVETDIGLMTHLVSDHHVYWIGSVGEASPEYVLLDQDSGLGSPPDAVTYAQEAHGGSWVSVYDANGYQLAQRQ